MLVSLNKILGEADKGGYAVPAFNINNMEILQAIVAAAVKMRAPVIIQTSEGAIKYAGMDYLVAMVKVAAKVPVPIALHLDHGKDLKVIKHAIESGYTSVMIDASTLPYRKNIAKTKKVVELANKKGVSVEAELGAIEGVEDLIKVSEKQEVFTDPEQAKNFVKRTGCDALAISIGTAHGPCKFKGKPQLDFKRLKKIDELVKVPLVLHGASQVPQQYIRMAKKYGGKIKKANGVSDSLLKRAIKLGIRKVNTDTDLRLVFNGVIRKTLKREPEIYDPRKILRPVREEMIKIAEHRIMVCGCKGRG